MACSVDLCVILKVQVLHEHWWEWITGDKHRIGASACLSKDRGKWGFWAFSASTQVLVALRRFSIHRAWQNDGAEAWDTKKRKNCLSSTSPKVPSLVWCRRLRGFWSGLEPEKGDWEKSASPRLKLSIRELQKDNGYVSRTTANQWIIYTLYMA